MSPGRQARAGAAFAGLALLALLSACGSPAQRFLDDAASRGFTVYTTDDPQRPVLLRTATSRRDASLHVYLDGDGRPWRSGRRPAADPTTRERLVLDLMQADPAPSVLVGRPCYYHVQPACDASAWTTQRYSEYVVQQLVEAIEHEIARAAPGTVVLIGYSGGGALAMLAAPRLSRVDAVITVAANLDVAAWARDHGQAPPAASLDPAREPALPTRIGQYHFFGADDVNVRAASMRPVAARVAGARVEVVSGYDHRCCWARDWRERLARALRELHVTSTAMRGDDTRGGSQ